MKGILLYVAVNTASSVYFYFCADQVILLRPHVVLARPCRGGCRVNLASFLLRDD